MNDVFIARQPILDRQGRCIAQELLFRSTEVDIATIDDGFACTAYVIERILGYIGLTQTVGEGDAYLNCTDEFLLSDLVFLLPPSRFVLEILEDAQLTAELAARCDALRRAGFRLALDDVRVPTAEQVIFLKHVDIVKLDWPFIAEVDIDNAISEIKQAGCLVLAEKVELPEQHSRASSAGCDLFQGYYFAKPQLASAKRVRVPIGPLLNVLKMTDSDASDAELEAALRATPELVLHVLRLAGTAEKPHARDAAIMSIRQALTSVGRQQLTRWCCLLLYGLSNNSIETDPLIRTVQHRAEFMERAARREFSADRGYAEGAYLAGLLSLLHVAHAADIRTFVSALPLHASIKEAIIERQGRIGRLLTLAEVLECGDMGEILEQIVRLPLDDQYILVDSLNYRPP